MWDAVSFAFSFQQLQMIGDLKAENDILKEANENLVNRWDFLS